MSLYTEVDATPKKPIEPILKPFKDDFKTAVIDTRYTPLQDLLSYVEGSTWVVDYYSQVLDEHNELNGQDSSLSAVYQQYNRIWSLELKVTQDLSQVSQDETSSEITLQGSANIYPFMVPQVGDMFRTGIADGREGLFKVTSVQRRQMFKDAVHQIEYQLIAINDEIRIYDLDKKTQLTYYFVKDFLLNNQNPLLVEDQYNTAKKLEEYWHDLIYMYYHQYFSNEHRTILVPEQGFVTYDHGLTEFVKTIMDSTEDTPTFSIRQLNIGDDKLLTHHSLWTMLLRRDPKMMKYIYKEVGITTKNSFHKSALMAGLRYTGIHHIVYPVGFKGPIDYQNEQMVGKLLNEANPDFDPDKHSEDVINWYSKLLYKKVFLQSKMNKPRFDVNQLLINPVHFEDSYVLSNTFYNRNTSRLSLLEKLLLDYLDFKLINAKDVLKLCEDGNEWNDLEKFYFYPLLLLLIKYYLRRL